MRLGDRSRKFVRDELRRRGLALVRLGEGNHHLASRVDDRRQLPGDIDAALRGVPERLVELRERYTRVDPAVTTHSQWRDERVRGEIDLRWFRGDSPILWHYLEDERVTRLKYHTWLRHVRDVDALGLLDILEEDGAFGCWTFDFPGQPTVSRDLLDSVTELNFLATVCDGFAQDGYRILDIGAGYGRLAHRTIAAFPRIADYCCCDAIPESTFLAEFHLDHRGVCPPARVVGLDRVDDVFTGAMFDLALNIHSFSECTHVAVAWWMARLADLEVPYLLIVPNEPDELLTSEVDGSRRDFSRLIADAGYVLATKQEVITDPAVRDLLDIHDTFHLFRRR